jgi:hypothetical protein
MHNLYAGCLQIVTVTVRFETVRRACQVPLSDMPVAGTAQPSVAT